MRTKAKMLINSDNLELVDSETLESCRQVRLLLDSGPRTSLWRGSCAVDRVCIFSV